MYQVPTRKTRSHRRVACLLQFKKILGPRKFINSKFTALPTTFREDWEAFDGTIEGKQCIDLSPLLILPSYVSDIQISCQTLLWMVTIEIYCISFFVKIQIPYFSYPIQKRYIWWILLIKELFLNDCYPFKTLMNISLLIIFSLNV